MVEIDLSAFPDENLLIGSLVNKVASLYDSYGDCGTRCNHPSGDCNEDFCNKSNCMNCGVNNAIDDQDNCRGCCLECSEEVHFHRSHRGTAYRTEYGCQKLAYYYTCRYSWKYCSEILYAIENFDFSDFERFSILSLGAGPAPDLMAFEQINRKLQKPISYTGVDKNPYWKVLYDEIKLYCDDTDIGVFFKNVDVFSALEESVSPQMPYNILVIQYLISSFPDSQRSQMVDSLCDLLISNVISKKDDDEPFFVVLNDIDHHTQARNYFSTLFDKIKHHGYHGTIHKTHFKGRNSDYGDGSVKHASSANRFTIPGGIINKFNCAVQCSSAQMILEVR